MILAKRFLLGVCTIIPSILHAQGDECGAALPVVDGVNGPFTNVGATVSMPSWPCRSQNIRDVWFSYTATCTGLVFAGTCSPGTSLDTQLEVFAGSCGALRSIFCDDDGCGVRSSLVTWVAVTGQTYLIRVGGFGGMTGTFDLVLDCSGAPTNDECSGALPVSLGTNGPFSNIAATTSAHPMACGQGGSDVWFRYVQSCSGPVRVETCASTVLDTVIQVNEGSCPLPTPVACNDDDCGAASGLTFNAMAGTTYTIQVGGKAGAQGLFALRLRRLGSFVLQSNGCGQAFMGAAGSPNLGTVVTHSVRSPTGSAQVLWIGVTPMTTALCGGCDLGTLPIVFIPAGTFTATIPCDLALVGAEYFVQGADLGTFGGCALGSTFVQLTGTLRARIGA